MLATLANKPLLQWVWESESKVPLFDEVVFAVDSEEIAQLVRGFGAKCFMTSVSLRKWHGEADRASERKLVEADIWVNWQGDEPFINEQMIRDLLQTCQDDSDVWTLKKRIINPHEITSPQFAKVVCDDQGHALYFSRSPNPFLSR